MDCGPTCLKMIGHFYGRKFSLEYLREKCHITSYGVSLLGISEAAEKIGFKTLMARTTFDKMVDQVVLPCVLHWNNDHFVVLCEVEKERNFLKKTYGNVKLKVADPSHGIVSISKQEFLQKWAGGDKPGVLLALSPTNRFYESTVDSNDKGLGFGFLFKYLLPYKKYGFQLLFGLIIGSLISLVLPFLTKIMVDNGIAYKDMSFINLILISQLFLFVSSLFVDLIRNWILLHISARINISLISDFLFKLTKLPINFFDSKNLGDITQRVQDHKKIEEFLTITTLNTVFSVFNLIIYSVIIGFFHIELLAIFLAGGALSLIWISVFLKRRKVIDYSRFQEQRESQNSLLELVTGMQEIKLNNLERNRRWHWERVQVKLFKVNLKSLALEQFQETGFVLFSQLKNLLISYVAAKSVINGEITLGTMLSVSFIVGQMNGPLGQLLSFVKRAQDAKLSLDRLGEIHGKGDEELDEDLILNNQARQNSAVGMPDVPKTITLDSRAGIVLTGVSFGYGGPSSPQVLRDLNLHIPKGQVTAIVGMSGSGKTTLLKLLLKFYRPSQGEVLIDGVNLWNLSAKEWRQNCGTVMQEGHIFSDSIVRNIAAGDEAVDQIKLSHAIQVANLKDYISRAPLGLETKVGNSGIGMSGGQRQRLFIARAVYKDPEYIFFDEATSSLDANNEKAILDNLADFFKGRTVVVIAHRLSTVKNADQIVVLENGSIREVGDHQTLVKLQGRYFELIKNQLEIAA